jgi:hypothetical protein
MNNILYENNLNTFKIMNPALWDAAHSTGSNRFRIQPSRTGPLTLIFRMNNQDFFIHSKFRPDAEAHKIIQNSILDADHIIVLGLGLGYHLEAVMANKAKDSRVLLLEPDLEILKHSMHTVNWGKLLPRQDFFYCFGSDRNLLSMTLQHFVDVPSFNTFEYISLPSEVRFFDEYFKAARAEIENEVRTLLYDFQTRLAENSMVPRNILKNVSGILRSRPVKSLKRRFPGAPGFIVSAGPSLDRNVLFLKKVRNRGVIICVDTALKPLLKRGIQPHFTVTADPSYKNYLHLQGTEDQIEHFIVSDTGISTKVYEDFGDKTFSVSLGKPILKMMEQNIGELGEIEAWGSVISLALNFAIYLGLSPITFLGQDFAFSDMRNHCRGTSWEESWMEYSSDLDVVQRNEKNSIGGIKKVSDIPDIYGNKTLTSDKLLLYKNYLTKFLTSVPGIPFYNASEGGIMTEIESRYLHSVLQEFVYGREEIDLPSLHKIPVLHNPRNRTQLITFFKAKSSFFKKYRNKLNSTISQLDRAESGNLLFSSVWEYLQAAEKIKEQLYSNIQHGELLEMWSQGPIYDFLKGFKKLQKDGVLESNANEWVILFKNYFSKLRPIVSSIIDCFDAAAERLKNEKNHDEKQS